MKCQYPVFDCQNEGIIEYTNLYGEVSLVCFRCKKYSEMCSEILEPLDRQIIRNLQIQAGQIPTV